VDWIAEKYDGFAADCGASTADSPCTMYTEIPQMVIARIPVCDSLRSDRVPYHERHEARPRGAGSSSDDTIAQAMVFCEKQRLLWRVKSPVIDLPDRNEIAPVIEAFDIADPDSHTHEFHSCLPTDFQFSRFLRDFEVFKRAIMKVQIDTLSA